MSLNLTTYVANGGPVTLQVSDDFVTPALVRLAANMRVRVKYALNDEVGAINSFDQSNQSAPLMAFSYKWK